MPIYRCTRETEFPASEEADAHRPCLTAECGMGDEISLKKESNIAHTEIVE